MALFTRTICLIKMCIKICIEKLREYFRTDEEEEEYEEEYDEEEDWEDEYDDELKKKVYERVRESCMSVPINEERLRSFIYWAIDHMFLYMILGYIFCFIPILNLILTLIYLADILEEEI